MPFDGGGVDITVPAAADLSNYRYRIITLDGYGRGTVATAGTCIPLGILQNAPGTVDAPARVRISGLSLFVSGAALTATQLVCSGVQGAGTATTGAGTWAAGQVQNSTGGSGDICSVLVMRAKL